MQKDDWGQEEAVELKTGFCLPTFLSTKSKAKNHSCATMCLCTWRGTNTYVETRLEFNTSNFGLCVIISWASGCILSFPASICWKLVLKGSSSFGGELQMEALAPFLDCGLAVWLAEREVMNKLRRSSCLGRTSSLECKQGWNHFHHHSGGWSSAKKRQKCELTVCTRRLGVQLCVALCHFLLW